MPTKLKSKAKRQKDAKMHYEVLRCKIVVYNFSSLTNEDHKKVISFLKDKAKDLEKIYKKELLDKRFTMKLFK